MDGDRAKKNIVEPIILFNFILWVKKEVMWIVQDESNDEKGEPGA